MARVHPAVCRTVFQEWDSQVIQPYNLQLKKKNRSVRKVVIFHALFWFLNVHFVQFKWCRGVGA